MIEEIKQALEKATQGKWKWRVTKWDKGEDGEFCVGALEQDEQYEEMILEVFDNKYGMPEIFAWKESNAHLIANAPEYIRYLIGENDRLNKEWRYQGGQTTEALRQGGILETEARHLRGQVEELRKALEWYADEKNHDWKLDSFDCVIQSKVMEDEGERARQALERSEFK